MTSFYFVIANPCNMTLQPDMGQAFNEVLEAQVKAFIKGLKHKYKHLCFQKINA